MRRALSACVAGALALSALAACTATVSREGVANIPGEEVWKTEVELRLGERAIVDGNRLEVTLVSVGVNEATVLVESLGSQRQESLRTGPGGEFDFPPYQIRLLSTGINDTARFQIRRQWGQYR